MYLLDTNVVSATRQAAAEPVVAEWLAVKPAVGLFTSVIVAAEIEAGVLRVERRDPAQGRRLRKWATDQFLTWFGDRILGVDLAVANRSATFHVPDPAPRHDALIGATAAVHDLTVVTRNAKDFERFGVRVVDPWNA